jgi:CHAT domain-containing protein
VYRAQGNNENALAFSRRATAVVMVHGTVETSTARRKDRSDDFIEQRVKYFHNHVGNLVVAARKGQEPEVKLGKEAFEVAQWARRSSTAAAIQQMGTRLASGGGMLGTLVRDNQDLAARWGDKDKALITALSEGKDQAGIAALRREIAGIESRLAAVATRLEKEFPDYAALASPKPLKAEEAQGLLGPDEALAFFLTSDEESYVFALTREGFSWKTIAVPGKTLVEKVAALRRTIGDPSSAELARPDECGKVGGPGLARADCGTSGFDFGLAHDLYDTLFGSISDLVKDKKDLIVVPSGALTSVPFQVLITEVPQGGQPQLRDAAWLIKRHAITVLPSVASLRALRVFAKETRTGNPFIGFGNPVFQKGLTGPANRREKQRVASKDAVRGVSDYFRGGLGDINTLRHLAPLYDTADELKSIGSSLGAPAKDLILGVNASETTVKALSGSGRLAEYRVVAFATHGLVAGDIKGLAEPALALTVPDVPTEADDGLLTASEVATLKLNADWVILSACNTAAGDKPGAEALSGLARAFFYAGARGLLVSHWPVESSAAVKLTTTAITELKANPGIGRAEALRRAMLALMRDKSDPANLHPAIWAPFMMVGEGGAEKL